MPSPQPQALSDAPSPWVVRWSHLLTAQATVLDIACGAGRHLAWFAQRGHAVTGLDQDVTEAQRRVPHATLISADLERGPWPLLDGEQPQQFGAVVVTNYLWRPLFGTMVRSVAPGGVFLYETFGLGQETMGRPARAEYLLQPGELLAACRDLHVVAYENGTLEHPLRFVQRIAAVRRPGPDSSTAHPEQHAL